MPSLRTLFRGPRPTSSLETDTQPDAAADAMLEISTAVLFALQRRSDEMDLAGHAARVAQLADRLAANQGVSDELRQTLRRAALLHEVGMMGIPRELLHRAEPLTAAELARVHAQAEFAAQVALATAGHLAATIIRHQYDDEATLRRVLGEGSDAYLLTLFLRAADVADVISRGRPAEGDGAPEPGLHLRQPQGMLKMSRESAEAYAAAMAA